MTPARLTAYVDESIRRLDDDRLCYVIVAAVLPAADTAAVTVKLRAALLAGQRRFHWRAERASQQLRFLDAIVGVTDAVQLHAVAIANVAEGTKTEQARTRCLWSLLGHLGEQQVSEMVLESRRDHNDAKDRRDIIDARKAGLVPAEFVYRHTRPRQEPLLWVPDALAGAWGNHVTGRDPKAWEMLPEGLCLVEWVGEEP